MDLNEKIISRRMREFEWCLNNCFIFNRVVKIAHNVQFLGNHSNPKKILLKERKSKLIYQQTRKSFEEFSQIEIFHREEPELKNGLFEVISKHLCSLELLFQLKRVNLTISICR